MKNIKLPCTLVYSHVASKTFEIKLNNKDAEKGKIKLSIRLEEKANQLDELTIHGSRLYILQHRVVDFEIDDSNIYCLCIKNDKRIIQYYTLFEYLKREQTVPKQCDRISYDSKHRIRIKDKYKNYYWLINDKDINLIGIEYDSVAVNLKSYIMRYNYYKPNKDDIFETWFKDVERFVYPQWFNQNSFERYVGSTENNLFFTTYPFMGQVTLLFRVYLDKNNSLKYSCMYFIITSFLAKWFKPKPNNSYTELKNMGIKIPNKIAQKAHCAISSGKIKNEFEFRAILTPKCIPGSWPLEDNHAYLFWQWEQEHYHVNIEYAVSNNQLYIEDGLIYTLNNDNQCINQTFMNDTLKNDYPVDAIIFDNTGTRCFIRQNTFGGTLLKEIDFKTGKYKRIIKLLKQGVEKVRVAGNKVYFTASIEDYSGIEKMLFVQQINK